MPAPLADPRQSHDLEQISPATIAHHTVYEKTRSLQQNHVCQWRAQSYLVGPLSRLVGKPRSEPSLSKNVLPSLTTAAYGPNGAILLTQTFNRILFYCNGRYFGVQKARNRDRGRIVFTAALKKYMNACRHSEHAPVRRKMPKRYVLQQVPRDFLPCHLLSTCWYFTLRVTFCDNRMT